LSVTEPAGAKKQGDGGEEVKLDFLGGPVKMPGESTSAWIKRRAAFRKAQVKKLMGSSQGESAKQQGEFSAPNSVDFVEAAPAHKGSFRDTPAAPPQSQVPSRAPPQRQAAPQQQQGVVKPQRETCLACHKPHFVTAQHPSGLVGEVQSYLKGDGVPHMMQLFGGGWICEWCRYYHCGRCNELQLDEKNQEPGLWGKERACNPKWRELVLWRGCTA